MKIVVCARAPLLRDRFPTTIFTTGDLDLRGCLPMNLPHPGIGVAFPSPIPPGTGWPGDVATSHTPIARDADDIAVLASEVDLIELTARSSVCRACPRLVRWREQVSVAKRRAFAAEPYWGRPVPGWGDPAPTVLIIGLAPAAHGGNRTGRIFTGDRSGDWLFAALYRVGLATQPTSVHAADGLQLVGCRVVAAVRCAPPGNAPNPVERDTCARWLDREVQLVLATMRAVVTLGSFAWAAGLATLGRSGFEIPRPRPAFGHGAEATLDRSDGPAIRLIGCYHPSQQNTFTGKLTEAMLDEILRRAITTA